MLQSNPIIYSAGKPYNARRFREMRDGYGYNVKARWIDMSEQTALNKTLVAEVCIEDSRNADMVIIYCHKLDDYLLFTIGEACAALAMGKVVYSINDSMHLIPSDLSDCAYSSHPRWTKLLNEDGSHVHILEGYRRAMKHYVRNHWPSTEYTKAA